MAKIKLNGKNFDIGKGINLAKLLNSLKISSKKVAIEVNGVIATKNNYRKKELSNGDKVEIVHFIGGG